ncbi:hypothetical protein [Marinobacter sp. V034]|uniref:hypothetical protein n=1 Tax=Marinobacter sp. V034 TaxID=3459610 RepID=UPI004044D031
MRSLFSSSVLKEGRVFTPESRRIYLIFIIINVIVFLAVVLLPVEAKNSNYVFLFFINLIFFSVVSIVSFLIFKSRAIEHCSEFTEFQIRCAKKNVMYCCVASIVGGALVGYDRVFVRGIDYSKGLRAARYEWLASDGGSFFSVFGNILVPFCFVGIFFLIVNSRFFKAASFFLYFALFLSVVFFHAALNGGRSNILLVIVIVVIALALRNDRINVKTWIKVSFLCVCLSFVAFFYVAKIIKSSASMGHVDLSVLLVRAVDGLQGKFVEGYAVQSSSDIELLFLYISSYLVHGQWTAQAIPDLVYMPGSYFLYPFSVILARLKIIESPLEQGAFSDVGAFVSLPAAIYYDFGFLGLAFLSTIIGILFGFCLLFFKSRSRVRGWALGFSIYLLFVVFLSPVIPAYGFSYLNFIVFSFFVLGFINRLFFGKRYRLI